MKQEAYEKQAKKKAEKEKELMERLLKEEFDKDKKEWLLQENEKSETYQQIVKEIQMGKNKTQDLQSKLSLMSRELRNYQKECDDLELEKRGKERQMR